MDKYPISASSLERFFRIDGKQFDRQYKEHLSGYEDWKRSEEGSHAEERLVFPQNVGPRLSIDETTLSNGELYTVVSNKDVHVQKLALKALQDVRIEHRHEALREENRLAAAARAAARKGEDTAR